MDKFKQEDKNFEQFETFINDLEPNQAKEFIIEFFKNYKYLLSNDIARVTDETLKIIQRKQIAVVASSIPNLFEWVILNKVDNVGKHPRHYRKGNTLYIGVVKPTDVIGFKFDEVIYTPNASENKDIDEIITHITPCLIPNVNKTRP